MMLYILAGVVLTAIVVWFILTKRVLLMLDENKKNAMAQIGVQVSGRWDAVSELIYLIKEYSESDYAELSETIKQRQYINAESSAQDAAAQNNMLRQVMVRIMAVAERYTELRANSEFQKNVDSINMYDGMIRQSRLVYNDSITNFNRSISSLPTSFLARALGFSMCEYLEAKDEENSVPNAK
ncbi:MAG: LemA family protein [Hydrogenoanaerobacterium sp.]